MKTLIKYLKPYYVRMLIGFIIKVAGTVVELFIPYILSHVLKNVIVRQSIKETVLGGVMMIVCAVLCCYLNIVANRMAAYVSRNFSETLRRDLFYKTLSLSASQTDKFTIASLESRITTDTYNIHNFVGMMQRMGVRAPILFLGGIVVTMIMDIYLSLAVLCVLPFVFFIVLFISKKGIPLYSRVQKSVDNMVRVVREDVSGIRVIKALSKNEHEHLRYDNTNKALVKDEETAGITMGLVNPIMTFLMNLGIVAVIWLSASRVSVGKSDPETVIAFMQYFTMLSMAMLATTRMFAMYSKCAASAKRVQEVLLCEEELSEFSSEDFPEKETDAFIEFDNVSFSYEGNKPDISEISFKLQKGGSLGIIGSTGSGKSTIIGLLLRLYDVSSGNIYISGLDIRTMKKSELYALFGTVLQNDFLFADTIAENIRFGRSISDEQLFDATKISQAHEFISSFAEGYNHVLSQKATNISGGQKQRVLIARSLADSPEILILDDSSSALDYKTEAALRSALNEKKNNTTFITVAQRVSAVKQCDLILVLDGGRIIGSGTHEQLLSSCVEYREISDSQLGGAFLA